PWRRAGGIAVSNVGERIFAELSVGNGQARKAFASDEICVRDQVGHTFAAGVGIEEEEQFFVKVIGFGREAIGVGFVKERHASRGRGHGRVVGQKIARGVGVQVIVGVRLVGRAGIQFHVGRAIVAESEKFQVVAGIKTPV